MPAPRRSTYLLPLALAAAFYALAALLILSGTDSEQARFDQDNFHLPVVERFSKELPRPDLADYASATTPGYHLLFATLHRLGLTNLTHLRLLSALLGAGLVFTLALDAARRNRHPFALTATLPLAASLYILTSAAWLSPHNAAWWLLAGLLIVALRPALDLASMLLIGSLLVLLVVTRQVHLWAAGLAVAAAFLTSPRAEDAPASALPPSLLPPGLLPPPGDRAPALARAALMAALCLPAVVTLLLFVRLWGGLTPPAFAPPRGSSLTTEAFTIVGGVSPATPAFILALFGCFGLFFAPLFLSALRRDALSPHPRPGHWLLPVSVGIAAALLLSILPETTYRLPDRIGGLWNLVNKLPTFANRSPVIIAAAAAGGALLGFAWHTLPTRDRWVLAVALVGFVTAHTAQALVWQRYYEPFTLILLALAATRTRATPHPATWLGPTLLGGANLAACTFALSR
jgi:hypothetical protein